MFHNLHYLGVHTWDGRSYLLSPKRAERWPVEGAQVHFFCKRMPRLYALSKWLNDLAKQPLEWLSPSEDAWKIDLSQLQTAFNDGERSWRNHSLITWPEWFKGRVTLVPEWETIEPENGSNRFTFILTEWQVTKSRLPPISGSATTIFHGDQIHVNNFQGSIGHIGTHSSSNTQFIDYNADLAAMDMAKLAEELLLLRLELRRRADSVDHDRAIVAVGEAEEAARKNDPSKVLEKLKMAGSWAFDIASKIGVSVASEALKRTILLR